MTDEPFGRRASDRGPLAVLWANRADFWMFGITILVAWSLITMRSESTERQDQTCLLFERAEVTAVNQLKQTYDYLSKLTPKELTEGINPAIIAQLPQTEAAAKTADAPAYCNEPNVGLPEPDPMIPERPPGIPEPPPPP